MSEPEVFFMYSTQVRLEQFYFWTICLMALGGFLLGMLALFLMWRLHQEIRISTLEFRLRHDSLSKRVKQIAKGLNLPENGTAATPPGDDSVKLKLEDVKREAK